MKLIYLSVNGKMRLENWNGNKNTIEMPDGVHPLTNDSVWHDAKRRRPPVMILTQGAFPPYGASMAHTDVSNVLYSSEVAEKVFRPQSVSKMWHRQFTAAFRWLVASMMYLFVIALVAWSIWPLIFGGA